MHAAGSTIRVALYADIGSKYKSTVPAVTLQSDQSFNLLSGKVGTPVADHACKEQDSRVSLDGLPGKGAGKSPSWQAAADAAKKLQATSDKPQLFAAPEME
jgi:stage II sporulation protein D